MDTLNQSCYDVSMATSKLVPRGPVLCADELEAWSQGLSVATGVYVHSKCDRQKGYSYHARDGMWLRTTTR